MDRLEEIIGEKVTEIHKQAKVHIKIEFEDVNGICIGHLGEKVWKVYHHIEPVTYFNRQFLYIAKDIEEAKSAEFLKYCLENVIKYVDEGLFENGSKDIQ